MVPVQDDSDRSVGDRSLPSRILVEGLQHLSVLTVFPQILAGYNIQAILSEEEVIQ